MHRQHNAMLNVKKPKELKNGIILLANYNLSLTYLLFMLVYFQIYFYVRLVGTETQCQSFNVTFSL